MKRFTRLSVSVVVLFVGFVGAVYADPEFAGGWGLDFWNYSKAENELRESKRLSAKLTVCQEQTAWRIEYRQTLIDDLFEHRTALEPIVRQFQELNQHGQTKPEMIRLFYQAKTDRIAAIKQIIAYLKTREKEVARYDELGAEANELLLAETRP